MKKRDFFIWIGIVLVVGLLIPFILPTNNVVNLVGSEKFEELVNEDVFILQVHTPYYGEIAGTDLVIEDWENIENYLDLLPDKNVPIATYCRSGRMSGIVVEELSNLGYEVIYDLDGGMNAWEASGRSLESI